NVIRQGGDVESGRTHPLEREAGISLPVGQVGMGVEVGEGQPLLRDQPRGALDPVVPARSMCPNRPVRHARSFDDRGVAEAAARRQRDESARTVGVMRAVRLHADGLTVDEIDRPTPGEGDVLVRVRAAGLTRDELTWPTDRLPAIPSYE